MANPADAIVEVLNAFLRDELRGRRAACEWWVFQHRCGSFGGVDFSPASLAAAIEAVRVRCDDQTFAVLATPQAPYFQPVVGDRTLPGAGAIRPRSLAAAAVYSADALYRSQHFQAYVVADQGFAGIAQALVVQEVARQLDEYDRRYPPTAGLYSPQSY